MQIWNNNCWQIKRNWKTHVPQCSSQHCYLIARTWKQPRRPSTGEWKRKLWYIYTTEYYSVIKKNTFESVLMRWMKLESIIQSELSQKEKHQYSMLLLLLLSRFSRVWLCVTPWTVAYQAPPSMGFSRQECWSGLPLAIVNNVAVNIPACFCDYMFPIFLTICLQWN